MYDFEGSREGEVSAASIHVMCVFQSLEGGGKEKWTWGRSPTVHKVNKPHFFVFTLAGRFVNNARKQVHSLRRYAAS